MRYRLAVLTLFAVLPGMNGWAAPGPPPSAILQIAPPPKGETAEKYRKGEIEGQTNHFMLARVWSYPEVRKLPSVARMEDGRPWLAENLRITEEKGGRYLRFTFRAGSHDEQVAILNAFLRANLAMIEQDIKVNEDWIRRFENDIINLERRKESADYLRSVQIPAFRAHIARQKQFTVIRWAK